MESREDKALDKFETSNLSTTPKLKSKESAEQLTTGNTHVDKIIRGTLLKNSNNCNSACCHQNSTVLLHISGFSAFTLVSKTFVGVLFSFYLF